MTPTSEKHDCDCGCHDPKRHANPHKDCGICCHWKAFPETCNQCSSGKLEPRPERIAGF